MNSTFVINGDGVGFIEGARTREETPDRIVGFKRTSKKRSWVWDWFEQDQVNKYRAICLYCSEEVYRTENDKGSPKKLETHLNKHGVTRENFLNRDLMALRKGGVANTANRSNTKTVSFKPVQATNLGPINNQLPPTYSEEPAFIQSPPKPLTQNFLPLEFEPSPQPPQPQIHHDNEPLQMPPPPPPPQPMQFGPPFQQSPNFIPMQNQLFPPPMPPNMNGYPPNFVPPPFPMPMPPMMPPPGEQGKLPPNLPQGMIPMPPPQFIENKAIDPDLHYETRAQLVEKVDIDSIMRYNSKISHHNEQIEKYNKLIMLRNDKSALLEANIHEDDEEEDEIDSADEEVLPNGNIYDDEEAEDDDEYDDEADITAENGMVKNNIQEDIDMVDSTGSSEGIKLVEADILQKPFVKQIAPFTENRSQIAIREFIVENGLDVSVLNTPSFTNLVKVLRKNLYEAIDRE